MKIAAVGAGRMGRGIALAFAYAGHDVALVDLKVRSDWNRLREEAMAEMQASLAMLAELGAMPADAVGRVMSRIKVHPQTEARLLAQAEIIFEAVPETLEAKRDAFARICELAAPDAVLASTTSTILVTDLVPLVTRPERLLNAHWLNPAYLIPLVELSTHPGTASDVVNKIRATFTGVLQNKLGTKSPIRDRIGRKRTGGFGRSARKGAVRLHRRARQFAANLLVIDVSTYQLAAGGWSNFPVSGCT